MAGDGQGREFWGRKLNVNHPIVLHPVERSFHLVKAVLRPITIPMQQGYDYVQLLVFNGSVPEEEVEVHRFVNVTSQILNEKHLGFVFKKGTNVTLSTNVSEQYRHFHRDFITVDLIGFFLDDKEVDNFKALEKRLTVEKVELYAKHVTITEVKDMEGYEGCGGEDGDETEEGGGKLSAVTSLHGQLKRSQLEVLMLQQKVKKLEEARKSIPTIIVTEASDDEETLASW